MITKSEFLEKILNINSKYNTELIGQAFDKAQALHEGQLRKSGEPYFIHPINVALILAEMGMDDATIIGGLLHDVVEDTEYTREQLVADFGSGRLGSLAAELEQREDDERHVAVELLAGLLDLHETGSGLAVERRDGGGHFILQKLFDVHGIRFLGRNGTGTGFISDGAGRFRLFRETDSRPAISK